MFGFAFIILFKTYNKWDYSIIDWYNVREIRLLCRISLLQQKGIGVCDSDFEWKLS